MIESKSVMMITRPTERTEVKQITDDRYREVDKTHV
jgi:hypothetical protein